MELLYFVLVGLGLLEMQKTPAKLFHASLAASADMASKSAWTPAMLRDVCCGLWGNDFSKVLLFSFLVVISFSLKMACEIASTFLSI